MIAYIFYLCFILSFTFFIVNIRLIKKRKLKEQYALLWLFLSVLMMVLSLFPSGLDWIAKLIGVKYAPSLLYLLAILGIFCILLHLTITVSVLAERTTKLAQVIAIYEEKLYQLQDVNQHQNHSKHGGTPS
ncbi:DUF2304 domain-containing protein [Bacillus chungangensis]|uniref:DUF2304 domain-containing protein n=1 Tax=Bacillus chungangensis TaxID=587633 RepID=A0ABT9WY94_9BACI|nr:DUF2304 domain-containing protein [Bacillus chungangensis]MDQ0178083.1 hypothetical protein [Bacillus chungangensis]